MRETIPNSYFILENGDEDPNSTGWGQYVEHEDVAYYTKVFFGYFDLSGYTREQKTTFIRDVMFQDIGNTGLNGLLTGAKIDEARIVSTTPMDIQDFILQSHGTWQLPGAPTSDFNSEEIVVGVQASYEMDVGANIGRVTQTSGWGVGDSTAAQKLYYARAFRFIRAVEGVTTSYSIITPAVQVVVPILIGTEPDLEYMMRLKRSLDPA